MHYFESLEYKEDKDNLYGEYKDAYQAIEGYYIQVYTGQSYEVQSSLKQILKDFLKAQESEKPLKMIAGDDIKEYALSIIETRFNENRKPSNPLYLLTTAMTIVWLILFMMFVRSFSYDDYTGYSFIEKMRHLYFGIELLIVIALIYVLDFVRRSLTKKLFYRLGLIRVIHILFMIILSLLVVLYISYTNPTASLLSLRIPEALFLILALITTIYIIVVSIASYRKTKAKKRALVVYEEINIEQVACPSCGLNHDIDYPKCPSCGYRNN